MRTQIVYHSHLQQITDYTNKLLSVTCELSRLAEPKIEDSMQSWCRENTYLIHKTPLIANYNRSIYPIHKTPLIANYDRNIYPSHKTPLKANCNQNIYPIHKTSLIAN